MFKSPSTRFDLLPAPEPDMTVQGQTIDSLNELYVAQALEHVQLPFIYQFQFGARRNGPGWFVVDFLVLTEPMSTPLFVNGEYWHREPGREFIQIASLPAEAKSEMLQPVILWGEETTDPETALNTVRKRFIR